MIRQLTTAFCVLSLMGVGTPFVSAQDAATPAALELLLPTEAKATLDGKAVDNPRAVSLADIKPNEIRRVKIAVTFADGGTDDRLVDVLAGQKLRIAIPQPGPDKAMVVPAHPLVPINSAAISADGRFIALGLDAKTIVVWDTTAGRPVRSLAGHQKAVFAVAFSPDGKKLLSGSADTTAILWNLESGAPLRTYKGHTKAIPSVAFSPDGKRFLTGSHDGSAIVWETDTGEQVHKLNGRRDVFGVAYSPDGNTLATASVDYTATLWDAKTGQQTFVLRGHREDVNSIAFSPDGKRVVTGSSEDFGIVWDAVAGKRITRTGRHTNNVHSATFTTDGLRVITGEREELVMMWDAFTGAPARTFVGHGAEIFSIVPCLAGTALLTCSRDGTARLWDLATGRELLALTTSANGRDWAVASADGLFDGTDAGRRALGYRFSKGGMGELDQFFAKGFYPGLLSEIWRGGRPLPMSTLGKFKPPLVKLLVPKERTVPSPSATLEAVVTDQGGLFSDLMIENNGTRLQVPLKASHPTSEPKSVRYTFTVPLAPGVNRIGVRSATQDYSRETVASVSEMTCSQAASPRGRLYVVAIGIDEYADAGWKLATAKSDVRALAELLRTRGGKQFERVDVVPIFDGDATRDGILDTIQDVAELTRPQDAIVVLMSVRGYATGSQVYTLTSDARVKDAFPNPNHVRFDSIAKTIGSAKALDRAIVFSATRATTDEDPPRDTSDFRGVIERLGRAHGLHLLTEIAGPDAPADRKRGALAAALLDDAGSDTLDLANWFHSAAERFRPTDPNRVRTAPDVQVSTRSKSFPLMGPRR